YAPVGSCDGALATSDLLGDDGGAGTDDDDDGGRGENYHDSPPRRRSSPPSRRPSSSRSPMRSARQRRPALDAATSSSFECVDDVSATIPRSNRKGGGGGRQESPLPPPVLELSSLFRSEGRGRRPTVESEGKAEGNAEGEGGRRRRKSLGGGEKEGEENLSLPPKIPPSEGPSPASSDEKDAEFREPSVSAARQRLRQSDSGSSRALWGSFLVAPLVGDRRLPPGSSSLGSIREEGSDEEDEEDEDPRAQAPCESKICAATGRPSRSCPRPWPPAILGGGGTLRPLAARACAPTNASASFFLRLRRRAPPVRAAPAEVATNSTGRQPKEDEVLTEVHSFRQDLCISWMFLPAKTDPQIMEVMDFLEDEIDGHTYDDLVPLQIRMALEDQVFGWDHFFSNILGHVGFTVGSYLFTFWLITFVVLREVPWGHRVEDAGARSNGPWGVPHGLFSFVRTALSLGSAVSTFRTIRRRRRVWLPRSGAGGGTAFADGSGVVDPRRRASLAEADRRARRFVLGSRLWAKMQRSYTKRKDRYLTKRVNRRLLRAQRMFERRHRYRATLMKNLSASSLVDDGGGAGGGGGGGGGSVGSRGGRSSGGRRAVASALARHGHEGSHHERVRMLGAAPGSVAGHRSLTDEQDDASLGGGSSTSVPDRGAGGGRGAAGPPSFQFAMDSHTLPNFAMESVSHDQMPFAHGEIKKIPYVHGGFFGAAPFMLTNPHWIAILRILMPDVYVEISRRASYAPAPRLIHWAENNPVVAAYGTAHEIEFSGRVPTLEWDVFLDPYLVRRVEIVLREKEAFLQRQKDARKKSREEAKADEAAGKGKGTGGGGGGGEGGEDERGNATSTTSQSGATPVNAADERLVLSYYDKEIKRRTTILVDRMLIAHGNLAQLVLEQTGYFKKYNFSRVKRTRKTLGGGIFARQWLAVYSEAMKLGMGYEEGAEDEVSDSGTIEGSLEEREYVHFEKDADFRASKEDPRREDPSPRSSGNANDDDGYDDDVDQRMFSPSSSRSVDAEVFRTPRNDERGPPRKIVMMRDNNEDDDTDGSINSEPSVSSEPSFRTPRMSGRRRRRHHKSAPTPPSLERVDATSLQMAAICPDKSIAESISVLKPIVQCSAPFGLVMDMKSRHVSRRVWALVIDFLRDCGARVEGIASFIVEEVRDITQYCSSSVNEIVFIHSAGDLQHGCHTGQIRRGDRVFFNAGSLLWDYPNLYDAEVVKSILWHRFQPWFDEREIKEGYRLKPYAKTTKSSRSSPKHQLLSESESETCDESTLDDGDSITSDSLFTGLLIAEQKKKAQSKMEFAYEEALDGVCSTIQQYKEYYQLSIGLYVQEFAVDECAISLIVKYVNSNLHVYDLGLSWGGINGLTVKGIQPGRFTATDGLWNQRYGGMPWRSDLKPSSVLSTES
ncbi:hypothetical protein ACHAWF_016373, partial [Thalassiosira exigua]